MMNYNPYKKSARKTTPKQRRRLLELLIEFATRHNQTKIEARAKALLAEQSKDERS